jgi:hypothetical protein
MKFINLKNIQMILLFVAIFFLIKLDIFNRIQTGFINLSLLSWLKGSMMFFGSMLFLSIRWYFLALAFQVELKNNWLQRLDLYYRALFFNTILPGSISGDLIRGMQNSHQNWQSYAIIFSERIIGLCVLLIMYLHWLILKIWIHPFEYPLGWGIYLLTVLIMLWVCFKFIILLASSLFKIQIIESKIWIAFISNIISHCLIIAIYFILQSEVHLVITQGKLFEILMISLLSSAIPLSVFGFGVKDLTLIALLGDFGIPSDQAMLYALLFFTILMSQVMIGGVLEIISKIRKD